MSTAEKKLITRIERVKRQLNELGPMRPGSITRQYRKPQEKQQPFYQIVSGQAKCTRDGQVKMYHFA